MTTEDSPPVQSDTEERYRSIWEMANDGIVVIQDNKIAMVNPAFARMLEYEIKDIIGRSFDSFLDPVASHLYKENQESFTFGESNRPSFRARLIKKRNKIINVEMSTADFIFEGQPAIVGIVRDITRQMELEAAVEASEVRYRTLYESSPIAYFTLSQRGTIQEVNSAAESLLGYSSEEMLKRNIMTFSASNGDSHADAKRIISEALQGKQLKDFEIQLHRKDDKNIWVSITSNPLETSSNSGVSQIGFMALDIDRRKTAEERANMERERANLYLEVMTHDLNNVNQSLIFAMGLMESSMDLPERIQELVDETQWNVRRSARMIGNMRAIITLRDNPPLMEKVDPAPLLLSAIESVERDFSWKKITINSNVVGNEFEVEGHKFLENVFFNIIHNAVMFDDRTEVEIDVKARIDETGKHVLFEFCDNGCGVPDSLKEFIFRRTGKPSEQVVGRGLGLTLVDNIVTSLEGTVWVEDKVKGDYSKGSKFVVQLKRWIEREELPCGRETCITFYKSNHCLFCEPVYEILSGVIEELGINSECLRVLNVDDPSVEISESDLPMLPFIEICEKELSGFVSDDQIRTALFGLMMKPCYPEV